MLVGFPPRPLPLTDVSVPITDDILRNNSTVIVQANAGSAAPQAAAATSSQPSTASPRRRRAAASKRQAGKAVSAPRKRARGARSGATPKVAATSEGAASGGASPPRDTPGVTGAQALLASPPRNAKGPCPELGATLSPGRRRVGAAAKGKGKGIGKGKGKGKGNTGGSTRPTKRARKVGVHTLSGSSAPRRPASVSSRASSGSGRGGGHVLGDSATVSVGGGQAVALPPPAPGAGILSGGDADAVNRLASDPRTADLVKAPLAGLSALAGRGASGSIDTAVDFLRKASQLEVTQQYDIARANHRLASALAGNFEIVADTSSHALGMPT